MTHFKVCLSSTAVFTLKQPLTTTTSPPLPFSLPPSHMQRSVVSLLCHPQRGCACRTLITLTLLDGNQNIPGQNRSSIFSTCFVLLDVILNSKERHAHPFKTDTKGRFFVIGVSINWTTTRNSQTEVLDTWKATQLNFLRQQSVNYKHMLTVRFV